MSIATEITRLQGAKASLKTSIEAKGVTVPSATKLDGYASLVDAIQTGGGSDWELVGYMGAEFANEPTAFDFNEDGRINFTDYAFACDRENDPLILEQMQTFGIDQYVVLTVPQNLDETKFMYFDDLVANSMAAVPIPVGIDDNYNYLYAIVDFGSIEAGTMKAKTYWVYRGIPPYTAMLGYDAYIS